MTISSCSCYKKYFSHYRCNLDFKYYAYEDNHMYCTIELEDSYVIYRAIYWEAYTSTPIYKYVYIKTNCPYYIDGWDYISLYFNSFIYLDSESSSFKKESVDEFEGSYSSGWIKFDYNEFLFDEFDYGDPNVNEAISDKFEINESGDLERKFKNTFNSLSGIGQTLKDFITEEPLKIEFLEYWIPPYLKRVKKIDYSKFSKFNIKEKFLRNPEKKGSPKSWK